MQIHVLKKETGLWGVEEPVVSEVLCAVDMCMHRPMGN